MERVKGGVGSLLFMRNMVRLALYFSRVCRLGCCTNFAQTGWLTPEARWDNLGTVVNITRTEAVGGWQKISVKERMSDMFWQWGFSGYSYGRNHDDGFTIFVDE